MIPLRRKIRTEPMRLLVRHADAGPRRDTVGLDEWRGLTDLGRWQAEQLANRVGGLPILRVLSSPSLRCRQTVVPLARALRVDVEPYELLRVDADPAALARFLRDPESRSAVLCTHRETLLNVFTLYAAQGRRFIDGIAHMDTGSSWALYGGEGDWPLHVRWLRTNVSYERTDSGVAGMVSSR